MAQSQQKPLSGPLLASRAVKAMAPKGGIRQRMGLGPRDRSKGKGNSQEIHMAAPADNQVDCPSSSSSRPSATGATSSSSTRPLAVTGLRDEPDLRSVVRELFLENHLSATKANLVARAAQNVGAQGVGDLAAAGARGSNKNTHRDLMRCLLRGCTMPPLYMAKVPLWQNGVQVQGDLPVLLPHEVLSKIWQHNPQLLQEAKPTPTTLPELSALVTSVEEELGVPSGLVPLGLHGDGVPYSKNQSLEVLSWNLPGQPLWDRVVFAAIPKKFCCQCGCKGRCTWDAVLHIFSWSARHLLTGLFPTTRHEGQSLDKQRQKLAGQPLGFRAVLLQARGDWPFLKQLFQFPSWSSTRICWKCTATQETFKVCHSGAPWRAARLTAVSFLQELVATGVAPSPLLSCPGFKLDMVCIDWLHTVDLGVAQDILGNLLWESMLLEAGTRPQQLQGLWSKVKAYYQQHKPASQLENLTFDMIYKAGRSPKLRAKGGETRYLVPFGAELAQHCFERDPSKHWEAVSNLLKLLLELYLCVAQVPFNREAGATLCRKVCVLYQALAEEATKQHKPAWVQKPKLHLLQELMEYSTFDLGSPQNFWTYRDEAWVGWLGKAAHRRGGQDTPTCAATRALQRYRALASEAPDFKAK